MGGNGPLKTALLLSGGVDSIALAWWKRPDVAITIDYGQLAAHAEQTISAHICQELDIAHEVITIDCSSVGSGDLARGADHGDDQVDHHHDDDHGTDLWPYRNQLLITLAGMRAVTMGVDLLVIGTVRSDGERHRDGTPEFVRQMNALMSYQEGGLRVDAPGIKYTAAELVLASGVPPGLLAWAHSCHVADVACGDCRGCSKQEAVFDELGPQYWKL
jgi:7-cyano-7-deazaguanine synthase